MATEVNGGIKPGTPMERVLYEVKKIIVGQDHLLERMVVALLARGHILVEGVPGLAKTMAVKTLVTWPSVRSGEERNIFPFQEEADVMFNSSLLYELNVLKPHAHPTSATL